MGISLFDLAGLGLIGPYVTLVIDPESVLRGDFGQWFGWVGLPQDQKSLLIIFGIILIGIFLLKAISSVGINYIILCYSQDQQLRLKTFLMDSYQSLSYEDYLNRNSSEYIQSIQAYISPPIAAAQQTTEPINIDNKGPYSL